MNSDKFFDAAERSLPGEAPDIYVEKQLGPAETYSIVGTPKALLFLSKQCYDSAIGTAGNVHGLLLGPVQFDIRKADNEVVNTSRLNRTQKRRKLGWSYLVLIPFWGLAAYGAYMLIRNCC